MLAKKLPYPSVLRVSSSPHLSHRSEAQEEQEEAGGIFIMKQARRLWPFCLLPGTWYKNALCLKTLSSDALKAPWPDVLITSGRRSVAFALAIKQASNGHTKLIHLQTPRAPLHLFDLVFPMEHDEVSGDNIYPTFAALHHVTNEKLSTAAYELQNEIDRYPSPRVAMFIGGSTNKYHLKAKYMHKLVDDIVAFKQKHQGSLFISTSRRTGAENTQKLVQALGDHDQLWIYSGGEPNPYLAWLASADAIVVTNDSVNMMSEALVTAKPLYILNLPEHTDTKPARFARQLISRGMAKPFSVPLIAYEPEVYNECEGVVEEILRVIPA